MPFRPDRPYNELPPLPPGEDVETKAVLKACIAARAALAESMRNLRSRRGSSPFKVASHQ
jgi:hypothetical protein